MKKYLFALVAMATMTTNIVNAQTNQATDFGLGTIYVNENVTTHLVMPETIRLVDISTPAAFRRLLDLDRAVLAPHPSREKGTPGASGL